MLGGFRKWCKSHRINSWVLFYLLIYVVLLVKLIALRHLSNSLFFSFYSFAVTFYILSRFVISYFHEESHPHFDQNYEPTISFGIPSKNEEENICKTILKIAESDYPKDKFDIIAVNDGSTDNTFKEMLRAQAIARKMGVKVQVIDWKVNQGKRHGMAECIRKSKNDIIIFIDSDSFVSPWTTKKLVKYFAKKDVAAVAGHAFVHNADDNLLTKMQAVRYFVAFKAYKGSESLFGAVTCCSGCCSAYRRKYVLEVLGPWLNQKFLGVRCTYGDDRSLTNFLLEKNYNTHYCPSATSYTIVPNTFQKFMKQQLRWKKSWVRESLRACLFIWKRNPIMSISFYLSIFLTLFAPIAVVRALFWHPLATDAFPLIYLCGILLIAIVYCVYYNIYIKDRKWIYGMIFALFFTLVLIWQLPYAILTIRDSRWGTR